MIDFSQKKKHPLKLNISFNFKTDAFLFLKIFILIFYFSNNLSIVLFKSTCSDGKLSFKNSKQSTAAF